METETTVNYKRILSSDSDDESVYGKRQKSTWYYVLESESSIIDPSDYQETIYSFQDASTEFAADTPDTESHSEPENMIEFELASSESDASDNVNSCSSEPEDQCIIPLELSGSDSAVEDNISDSLGTSSSSNHHASSFSKHLCIQCKLKKTIHPLLTFCDNCFKGKKKLFPPHVNKRKRRRCNTQLKNKYSKLLETSQSTTSQNTVVSVSTEMVSSPETATSQLYTSQSSQEKPTEEQLLSGGFCNVCYSRPQNAGFVHRRIVHVYGCYQCSNRMWKTNGRCPICNIRTQMVAKIIVA